MIVHSSSEKYNIPYLAKYKASKITEGQERERDRNLLRSQSRKACHNNVS